MAASLRRPLKALAVSVFAKEKGRDSPSPQTPCRRPYGGRGVGHASSPPGPDFHARVGRSRRRISNVRRSEATQTTTPTATVASFFFRPAGRDGIGVTTEQPTSAHATAEQGNPRGVGGRARPGEATVAPALASSSLRHVIRSFQALSPALGGFLARASIRLVPARLRFFPLPDSHRRGGRRGVAVPLAVALHSASHPLGSPRSGAALPVGGRLGS